MSSIPLDPQISQEDIRLAGVDLTRHYLDRYYPNWRLAQVLTIRKLLDQRHSFYAELAEDIRQADDTDGSATIAQEVRNGLCHDAIAHCVQYVEDLFALIRAAYKPEQFVQRVVTYKAGEVTNEIRSFKADLKSIANAYHFPAEIPTLSPDAQQQFDHGISNLVIWTADLVEFYKEHWFFYNQYKHGLTVALRYSRVFPPDLVEADRNNAHPPFVAVYDNLDWKRAIKKGTASADHTTLPIFTASVRRALPALERNSAWLRWVRPKNLPFSLDPLVDHAFKARACIAIFCYNFRHAVDPDPEKWVFQLPVDHRTRDVYDCVVPQLGRMEPQPVGPVH